MKAEFISKDQFHCSHPATRSFQWELSRCVLHLPYKLVSSLLKAASRPLCNTVQCTPQIRSCPVTFSASHRRYSCKPGRFPLVIVYLASFYSSVGLSCVSLPSHGWLPPPTEIGVSAQHMLEKQFYCCLSGSFW